MEKAQALADIRDQVDLMRVPCVRGTEKTWSRRVSHAEKSVLKSLPLRSLQMSA